MNGSQKGCGSKEADRKDHALKEGLHISGVPKQAELTRSDGNQMSGHLRWGFGWGKVQDSLRERGYLLLDTGGS